MVEELKIVSIRFVPVLEKICVCLGYPLPQYYAKDVLGRAAVVIIELPKADDARERKSLSCEGDSEVTLQASCEIAAKKMALYLVESEKIMVYDVNLEARQAHEHAIQLYDLKKDVFERIAQHRCPADVYDVNPVEGVDWGTKFVRISYSSMLQNIIYKLGVPLTPIEILRLEEGMFVGVMYMVVPSSDCPIRVLEGDRMPNMEAARECFAQKAIKFMMSMYHFDVEDINFHFLSHSADSVVKKRTAFLEVEEYVYGFPEVKEPCTQFEVHGILSPPVVEARAEAFRRASLVPPKRTRGENSGSSSAVDGVRLLPPELSWASKRTRHGP